MNPSDRKSKYPRMLYAVVILLAITTITAVAIAGSLWKDDPVVDTPIAVVGMSAEDDPDLIKDGDTSDVDHHEEAVVNGHDSMPEELIEITLDAVEGLSWRFEPSILEIPAGHRVKLTLNNDGLVEHDVEIVGVSVDDIVVEDGSETHDRLGGGHHEDGVVAAHAKPGTTASVFFTANETGIYKYFCTIPGHEEAGMVGRLVVTN